MKKPGYHLANIKKEKVGTVEKIFEECQELLDAHAQKCKIMELIELSDLLGAIELYMKQEHPTYTIDDLKIMSSITQRVFINGHRN